MLAEQARDGHSNLAAGGPRPPLPGAQPPVNFFSIESAHPTREFWRALLRLLDTLRNAAVRKAVRQQ